MLYFSILIHLVGRFLPSWILKGKFRQSQTKINLSYILLKMTGVVLDFILAIMIISAVTLTNRHSYIANECEVYGIICSNEIKEMGFQDGDRILTINNIKMERFREILKTIYHQIPPIEIQVLRENNALSITLTDQDQMILLESEKFDHFKPKTENSDANKSTVIRQHQPGLNDFVFTSKVVFNEVSKFLNPKKNTSEKVGVFNTKSISGWLLMLATCLLIVSIINMLPIPGLDFGDFIIASIEKMRNNKFDAKKLLIVKIVCLSSVVFLFTIIYL